MSRHRPTADKIARARRAADERKQEARESDRRRLLPLEPEHEGIELRAGKERQHDRADAGEEFDPALVSPEHGRPDELAEDQLGGGSYHDFGPRFGFPQPDQ